MTAVTFNAYSIYGFYRKRKVKKKTNNIQPDCGHLKEKTIFNRSIAKHVRVKIPFWDEPNWFFVNISISIVKN